MESPVYSAQQINGAPLRSGLRQIASQLHHLSDVGRNKPVSFYYRGSPLTNGVIVPTSWGKRMSNIDPKNVKKHYESKPVSKVTKADLKEMSPSRLSQIASSRSASSEIKAAAVRMRKKKTGVIR